ncbi:MAG: Rqc2 family fibronectin-binding protein [Culicoidibacterales bacterium]
MKIDSLFVHALTKELSYLNEGTRIEKIHQPTQYDVIMNIRTPKGNAKLLLSIHPETFRFHQTNRIYENPKTPKSFCVVLRKYIEGGKIVKIEQLRQDRHIKLTIETYNAVGDFVRRFLYLELMGKHSNLILTDSEDLIIDALKRVDITKSEYREVLPKLRYILPYYGVENAPIKDFYIQPIYQKWLDQHNFQPEVLQLYAQTPKGYYYVGATAKQSYMSFFDLGELFNAEVEVLKFDLLSQAMDFYFHEITQKQQLQEKVSNLLIFVQKHYKKNLRKKEKLSKELYLAEDFQKYQEIGNLILAHQHKILKNQTMVELENFFTPEQKILKVALNPRINATQNAQSYFKKYNKAKTALIKVAEQIGATKMELTYFETIIQSLEQADLPQAIEIRQELEQQGYLKLKKQKEKVAKQLKFMTYSYEQTPILVGRNNLQNDYVTFKQKRKGFIWLHVKDFPGSHVLICAKEISTELLMAGATLAAYYSKMKTSENVNVDYTEVQHVSKPVGAKPGFVIYKEQKTVSITPSRVNLLHFFPNDQF